MIDGLDEISQKDRQPLLKGFLQMSLLCPELKVMISSREEADISSLLNSRAIMLRIGHSNADDIDLYFTQQTEEWLDTLEIDDDTYTSLQRILSSVPSKAEGQKALPLMVDPWLTNQECFSMPNL